MNVKAACGPVFPNFGPPIASQVLHPGHDEPLLRTAGHRGAGVLGAERQGIQVPGRAQRKVGAGLEPLHREGTFPSSWKRKPTPWGGAVQPTSGRFPALCPACPIDKSQSFPKERLDSNFFCFWRCTNRLKWAKMAWKGPGNLKKYNIFLHNKQFLGRFCSFDCFWCVVGPQLRQIPPMRNRQDHHLPLESFLLQCDSRVGWSGFF